MRTKLELNSWNRKEHFEFFRKFDEPFYHLNMNVDCTFGLQKAKAAKHSIFAWYLFSAMKAANMVQEFRYRIEGEEVYEYNTVHASPTIGRDDGTFGFAQVDFQEDFEIFQSQLNKEMERVRGLSGLFTAPERPDVIHYSALPWFSFTGLSHPRNYGDGDSIPKISFGKIFAQDNKSWLPLSVQVHHGLVDGFHVNLFVEALLHRLNE
jgi:chloramphenicol O-acetyltransferase type A